MSAGSSLSVAHRFEVIAVRHGRTAWNADGRFQGHTDVPLDAEGRAQAAALGAAYAGDHFDRFVTSDLQRARETAEFIARGHAAPLVIDERWREMRFGAWEGLTWPQILERTPAMAGRSIRDPGGYVPEDGEAFAAVCDRVRDAVRALDGSARDGARIVVATHAGTLHALLNVALGAEAAAALGIKFLPASVTRLGFEPGGARVLELNRTVERPAAGHGAERG